MITVRLVQARMDAVGIADMDMLRELLDIAQKDFREIFATKPDQLNVNLAANLAILLECDLEDLTEPEAEIIPCSITRPVAVGLFCASLVLAGGAWALGITHGRNPHELADWGLLLAGAGSVFNVVFWLQTGHISWATAAVIGAWNAFAIGVVSMAVFDGVTDWGRMQWTLGAIVLGTVASLQWHLWNARYPLPGCRWFPPMSAAAWEWIPAMVVGLMIPSIFIAYVLTLAGLR